MPNLSTRVALLRWIVLSFGLGAPLPALAQSVAPPEEGPGLWVVPAIRTSAVHEDNTLLSDTKSEASFSRISPSFEVRARTSLHTLEALYTVDGERYGESRKVLNNTFARQLATGAFESHLNPRSTLSGRGRYVTTVRPEDALELVGLVLERRRAHAVSGDVLFEHLVTPRLRARAAYAIAREDYGPPTDVRPSARSTLHAGTAGFAFSVTPRTTVGVDYTGRLLLGDDLRPRSIVEGRFTANVVTARLTRTITPDLTATLAVGPRISEGLPDQIPSAGEAALPLRTAAEVLASLAFRRGERRVSVTYARSQFAGFGAAGFIDTESLEARAGARVARRLFLTARPAVYNNMLASLQARAYRFDAGVSIQTWGWLSIDATYVYRHQDRALTLADTATGGAPRPRSRNSFLVGLSIRRPILVN